ncbi:MAG: 6-carboxytetrahydropterin synthase [Planctomycetia bacterium]|nr:6-carboxytetrahydropterin synthase [Planctomycetia bacterium]
MSAAEYSYSVVIEGSEYHFNANHLVVFPCPDQGEDAWLGEPLHGHDYLVTLELSRALDSAGCVINFLEAQRALRQTLTKWNYTTILALDAHCLDYVEKDEQIEITLQEKNRRRRWSVPCNSVVWLDASNATAEEIARAVLTDFLETLLGVDADSTELIATLTLQESPGSFVRVTRR